MFTVRLVHRSATISLDALTGFSKALHQYVNTTLERTWGINAAVYAATSDTVWSDQDFRVMVYDVPEDATQSQVMGQHLWRGHGQPEGYVFAKMCELWGTQWDEILSHEVIEMLVDPWLTRYAKRDEDFWPVEVCDPVQGSFVTVWGYRMANFVTPPYYRDGSVGPFDAMSKLSEPFSVADGGFGQVYRNGSLVPLYGGKSPAQALPQNAARWSRATSRRNVCVA